MANDLPKMAEQLRVVMSERNIDSAIFENIHCVIEERAENILLSKDL